MAVALSSESYHPTSLTESCPQRLAAADSHHSIKTVSMQFGDVGESDLPGIIGRLRKLDPDIVMMQKVRNGVGFENGMDYAVTIANALGMNYHFGFDKMAGGPLLGNLTLSAFPIVKKNSDDLVKSRISGDNGCLYTKVAIRPNSYIHLFNLDIASTWIERRRQSKKLLDRSAIIEEALGEPILICGNFPADKAPRLISRLSQKYRQVSPDSSLKPAQLAFHNREISVLKSGLRNSGSKVLQKMALLLDLRIDPLGSLAP